MLTVFRICKTKLVSTAFDGEGSRLYGGRWNSPGQRIIYTASTLSLATLEMLVHLDDEQLLENYSYIPVSFEEVLIETVERLQSLPNKWNSSPPPFETQTIGDAWVRESLSVVLRVPSAIIPTEANYLINPLHADFEKISIGKIVSFKFDYRLAKKK